MKNRTVTGPGGSRDSKNNTSKLKRYSQIKPVQKSKAKTRKELRKQERKNKKAKKHAYAFSKSNKTGDEDNNETKYILSSEKEKKKKLKTNVHSEKLEANRNNKVGKATKKDTTSQRRSKESKDLRHDEAKLKREMEEVRRKRLLEDNLEEDRNIRQLEKKLKINKKAIIPASFRTDGLDYLLEICSSSKRKKDSKEKTTEKQNRTDSGSEDDEEKYSEVEDYDDDEDIVDNSRRSTSKTKRCRSKNDSDSEEVDSVDILGSSSENEDSFSENDEFGNEDSEDNDSNSEDRDGEEGGRSDPVDNEMLKQDYWEDIYGRIRNKDGLVIDEKTMQPKSDESAETPTGGKYVPPAKRGNQSAKEKIVKTLKGLLNRLAESNMHSISQQVEQLYMSNSRNEMNESLLELFYSSLVPEVAMSERIILEHVMLITILHANVGSEVGAYFIQNFVQKFKKIYDETDTDSLQDSKKLHNLSLLISATYHFKIVGSGLLFDLLNFMAESFKPKDIALILTVLRSVGFRLRKDDPLLLKNLILLLQDRTASSSEHSDSRVKFMLEIILAIKNNNMTKIPNYDPSYGEHLLKMLKQHFHKGNYVTELKIAMQDLLNADTKGKWWVVGSAWSNEDKLSTIPNLDVNKASVVPQSNISKKLLAKAKKFGMNTDTRRNVFCIIMTAEDYLDAFEKLIHLGLKNQLEREIVHVTVYCALHEKKYNPFYGLILSKLCSTERRFMYTSSLKSEVVKYAKTLGQRKVSRLFQISQKRIHEWIKESNLNSTEDESLLKIYEEKQSTVPSGSGEEPQNESTNRLRKRKADSSTADKGKQEISGERVEDEKRPKLSSKSQKQVLDLSVETELCEWVQSSYTYPTSTEIRNKAIELYRLKGHDTIKCSYGWYRRWGERFKTWVSTHEDSDPTVLSWLLEQYDDNNVVSYLKLQLYGQETQKKFKQNFKASQGWATRFVKRHHVFLNWDGFIEDKLPLILQARIDEFLSRIAQLNLSNLQENQIGSVDEIPLSFAGSSFKEKDNRDSDVKISRLKKICVKNCDATAIISLRADGCMLPPMVVVKGQKASSLNQVYSINDNPVIVFYSKSTEPTISALEKWLELVWLKNTKQPSVLFCDSYGLHHEFRTSCDDAGIKLQIFPSGCSCKLQPINVYAKLTFRKLIDNLWEEYLRKSSCESKIKLPSTNEMIEWVSLAYETMKIDQHKEKLLKSFKKVGLLTQGGTE